MKQIRYQPNRLIGFILLSTIFLIHAIGSCKKEVEAPSSQPGDVRITSSYTQDFESIYDLLMTGGWTGKSYVSYTDTSVVTADWTQGMVGADVKYDTGRYGFAAYSFTPGASYQPQDQFAYSYLTKIESNKSISSWLISPILTVKNGDMISFYTRGDTTGVYTDRMQVLLNKSGSTYIGQSLNSVGDFANVLFDINPTQAAGGFPTTWTKYEYTFSGLPNKMEARIAFRHYLVNPANARGVGIDLFKFTVK